MALEPPPPLLAKVLKNFHFWGGGPSISNWKGSLFYLHPSISPLLSRIQILDPVPHSQSSKVTCSLFLLFSLLSGQSKGGRRTSPFSVILSSPYFGWNHRSWKDLSFSSHYSFLFSFFSLSFIFYILSPALFCMKLTISPSSTSPHKDPNCRWPLPRWPPTMEIFTFFRPQILFK